MPVITRNQSKNVINVNPVITSVNVSVTEPFSKSFVDRTKILLANCEREKGMKNRMKIALEIYKNINQQIYKIIEVEGINKWIRFICVIYNKIVEFEAEYYSGSWNRIDKNLIEIFMNEVNKSKNFIVNTIKNYNELPLTDLILSVKSKIANSKSHRPRRNIPRVDYTGMDTIEHECEFDGITNIWSDLTIQEDPDYDFEEDEEDEEDEDQYEDDKSKWAKIYPELSSQEKTELKNHLFNLVEHHRVKRNVPKVNYAGMDMNEEDDGQIHISKRWFEDGKVKYIWKSYSMSKANEIGDEDYIDQ